MQCPIFSTFAQNTVQIRPDNLVKVKKGNRRGNGCDSTNGTRPNVWFLLTQRKPNAIIVVNGYTSKVQEYQSVAAYTTKYNIIVSF